MEINKETFTIQDLKKILKEAFDFDYEKHKGEAKFFPLTVVEWYKSDAFKNMLSLTNIKGNIRMICLPLLDNGGTYIHEQKSAVVFLKRLKILFDTQTSLQEQVLNCVEATMHELGHHYQDEFRYNINVWADFDINAFSYDIGYFVFRNNPNHYDEHHNEYWIEIDANLYGVERAYEFLESKGMLTKEIEEFLQKHKNQYLFDSNNYDIHYFLHECHKIVKKIIGYCLPFIHFSVYFIMIIVDLGLLIKF